MPLATLPVRAEMATHTYKWGGSRGSVVGVVIVVVLAVVVEVRDAVDVHTLCQHHRQTGSHSIYHEKNVFSAMHS